VHVTGNIKKKINFMLFVYKYKLLVQILLFPLCGYIKKKKKSMPGSLKLYFLFIKSQYQQHQNINIVLNKRFVAHVHNKSNEY
jgi:hypothetical protein